MQYLSREKTNSSSAFCWWEVRGGLMPNYGTRFVQQHCLQPGPDCCWQCYSAVGRRPGSRVQLSAWPTPPMKLQKGTGTHGWKPVRPTKSANLQTLSIA